MHQFDVMILLLKMNDEHAYINIIGRILWK